MATPRWSITYQRRSAQCHGYPQLVRGGRVPAARHEEAEATLSHAALVSLHSRGLVATWVQQMTIVPTQAVS